jgi:hypothetical protein
MCLATDESNWFADIHLLTNSTCLHAACVLEVEGKVHLRRTLHVAARRWNNIYSICKVSVGKDTFVSGSSEEKKERKSCETLCLYLYLFHIQSYEIKLNLNIVACGLYHLSKITEMSPWRNRDLRSQSIININVPTSYLRNTLLLLKIYRSVTVFHVERI